MRSKVPAILLAAAALGLMAAAPAKSVLPEPARPGVFEELQSNAWFLPNADETGSLWVTSIGKGPKVVVLHGGFGMTHDYLVPAVAPLADRWEFVLFDQRGSLRSRPRLEGKPLSVDGLVDDLEALRRALGEEKLTLYGHSMGSVLAMSYLRKYPDRVASLTLTGSFAPRYASKEAYKAFMDETNAHADALTKRPEVEAQLRAEGLFDLPQTASLQDRERAKRIQFASPNVIDLTHWRGLFGRGVYASQAGSVLGASVDPLWDVGKIAGGRKIPISIIQGDRDYVDPGAEAWLAYKAEGGAFAPCISVKVVTAAAHSPWVDHAAEYKADLGRALARKGC